MPNACARDDARNGSMAARTWPNFYRKPYGNGWALIGDAGLHQDP